jgi:hypothetical protein
MAASIPTPSASPPWYAHVAIGLGVVALGTLLLLRGQAEGQEVLGGGLVYLGVGGGSALSG